MDNTKLHFMTAEFVPLLRNADRNTAAKWGKMSFQQMVEHVADFFKVSSNKVQLPLVTAIEHLPKYKEFLLSDKQFRENTKAPTAVLGDEPLPVRNPNMEIAISKLQHQIDSFVSYFQQNPDAKTCHPVFGELDFSEWVLLHYKHVIHHARQFGLVS